MRLDLKQSDKSTGSVTAVAWGASNQIVSCGEDRTVQEWDLSRDKARSVMATLESYPASMALQRSSSAAAAGAAGGTNAKTSASGDVLVVGCCDGSIRFIGRTGRTEKTVAAHAGAVLRSIWNWDATALLTSGEDALVKIWSRSGMLRTTLVQGSVAVYAAAWGPQSTHVAYSQGDLVVVKPLQPGAKAVQWKAHDGVVLALDWSPVSGKIVTGAEDRRYRVWDHFGRQLYSSAPADYPITGLAWSPRGEVFAVAAFNLLRVCDSTGWTRCQGSTDAGSGYALAWSTDGTQLAAATAGGRVILATVLDRTREFEHVSLVLDKPNRMRACDAVAGTTDDLDFRDKVTDLALGKEHLVVTTISQCYVFDVRNWSTPTIFDLRNPVSVIVLARTAFLLVDSVTGIQQYSFDGRQISTVRHPGLNTTFLSAQDLALSHDAVVLVDQNKGKNKVHVFDASNGKALNEAPIAHSQNISCVALSQTHGSIKDCKLAFIDANRDLYISSVIVSSSSRSASKPVKLASMVSSMMWNQNSDMLAAVADGSIVVWYMPAVVFLDRDLVKTTCWTRDASDFGKAPRAVSFVGTRMTWRREDGALLTASLSPYPGKVYEHASRGDWDQAIRLCRFVADRRLWGLLGGMAIANSDLATAELAYASLDEIDKVLYLADIAKVGNATVREAELEVFRRNFDKAEAMLMHGGFVYRAILNNVRLHRWHRALKIAVKSKSHVDTLLSLRAKHLAATGKQETDQDYVKWSSKVTIDDEAIQAKIEQELAREGRTGATAGRAA